MKTIDRTAIAIGATVLLLSACGGPVAGDQVTITPDTPRGDQVTISPDAPRGGDAGIQNAGPAAAVAGSAEDCDAQRLHDAMPLASILERPLTAIVVDGATVATWSLPELKPPEGPMAILPWAPSHYVLETSSLGGTTLLGVAPPTVEITEPRMAAIRAAASSQTVLLLVSSHDRVVVAAVEDTDGSVVFAGDCSGFLANQLQGFRSTHPEFDEASGVTVLVNLTTNKDGAADALAEDFVKPARSWSDTDPALRVIDPEETPAEVLATLTYIRLQIAPAPNWAKIEGTICSRIPSIGWNECIRTSAMADELIELDGTTLAGQDLELWLLDERGDVKNPIAFLGVVPADRAIESIDGSTLVRLALDVETLDQISAAEGTLVDVPGS